MSAQQLFDVLLSIKTDEKSGKLYIYVKESNTRHIGTIIVGNGEISSITFLRKTGGLALEEILSLNVEGVVFLPQSGVAANEKSPDAPAIHTVLWNLKNKLTSSGIGVGGLKTADIRKEVEEILKKIYGPGIIKEIDRIANTYLIEQNPEGFLEQCKLKAQLMLSKDQVEKLFKPLYEKLKT
ncbi:MAG: hypothetical protein WBQ05_13340 [Candidatus Competibacter denitrificans]